MSSAALIASSVEVSPAASVLWGQWFLADVRHVFIRVGSGELLPTVNGSACLVDGVRLTPDGSNQGIEAVPGQEKARVYTQSVPLVSTTYGVLMPASRVMQTANPEVYQAALSVPGAPRPRFDFTLPPGTRSFTARIAGADVLGLIGAEGRAQLSMTATLATGEEVVRTLQARVDGTAPTGTATHALASGFGYLAHRDLSEDAVLFTLTFADGSLRSEAVSRGAVGVQLIEDPRSPVSVTATDLAGNVSDNLLVRATTTGRDNAPNRTVFAAWPLPAYLNARRPVLSALIQAGEAALNIGPEQAGDALSLTRASGSDLDDLALYYAVTRRAGESDASLIARTQARFLPRKSSRGGLKAQLGTTGAAGVQVADATSRYVAARTLDGSWTLDGSVLLGGAPVTADLGAGQIAVTFQSRPAAGWEAARALTRRHTAAGVVARLEYHLLTTAAVGLATRSDLSYRLTSSALGGPLGSISDSYFLRPLILDGSWTLNGAESIDGEKNGP